MKANLEKKIYFFLKSRLFRFLVVGFINTVFHNGIYYVLMNSNSWASTKNNFVAFIFSVQFAYWAHRYVTFSNPNQISTRASFIKFVIQAITNISLSSLFSYVVVDSLGYTYHYLIIFNVSVLPFISFTMMKFWVFKVKGPHASVE